MTARTTLALTCAAALLLAGCSASDGDNTVAGQAKEVSDRAYISGDGRVETVTPDKRREPVALTGTTLEGTPWNSADHRGGVTVVNVWGSWCPPCVAEMPELEKAYEKLNSGGRKVTFVGVNINESPTTAQAFAAKVGTKYPSLADDGGQTLIALQEKASTPPTTLVLDKQGRIAARVAGQTTASTLTGLVDDVAAEG